MGPMMRLSHKDPDLESDQDCCVPLIWLKTGLKTRGCLVVKILLGTHSSQEAYKECSMVKRVWLARTGMVI